MSLRRQLPFWRHWPDGLRWAGCFVLVLGVHATAAAALIGRWQPEDDAVTQGPVILIDLAPIEAAPAKTPNDVAPVPQPTQSRPAPAPEPTQEKTKKAEKPVKPDKPAVTADLKPPPEPPVEKVAPTPLPIPLPPPETQTVLQDVVMPPPRPAQEIKKYQRRQRLAKLTPEPARTEHEASRPRAPHAGARANNPNAVPRWKSALVRQLQRYKRYPAEAQARGVQGVAQLAFSVDRHGGVHRARIVRSSGSSLLDRATMQLIQRAQPLPPPPPEVRGAEIAIVVPISYNLR